MAVAYQTGVATKSAANVATLTSASMTVSGSNTYLLALVVSGAGSPVDPVSCKWGGSGGTAMTKVGTTLTFGTYWKATLYELVAPAAGANTLYVDYGTNQDETGVIGVLYTGVDQTTPRGTVGTGFNNNSHPQSATCTTVAGDTVVGAIFIGTSISGFSDSQTVRQSWAEIVPGYELASVGDKTASGTSTTVNWNTTYSAPWGAFAIPLKAAAASGAALEGAATAGATASGDLTTGSADTTFVDQVTGTTSATLPAHQAGDLILAFAFRDGNTTAPSVPSGQGWNTLYNSTGANSCAHAVAWKIAAGSSETTGTFTSATSVVFLIYRPGAGRGLLVGANASGGGSSTSVSYTGLTLQAASGKSWVVGFAGHRSTNTSLETAPSGMVNRSTVADATDEAAGHDTNGPVSSWSTTSVSVGGTSSGWRSHTVEVMSYALLAGGATAGASAAGTLSDVAGAVLEGDAAAGATAAADLTIGNVIGGGGSLPNEIEAAAMAGASASGALTTQIKLLAAAVSATTASGSLTTGISLAGAAASVTLAGGTLTTQIRLQGDALAAAVAAAGLTTAIQLAAAAQAGAQASGDLTTGAGAAALAGNALASAIASGSLTTIIRLDGAALASAIAQGVLSTGISLAGAVAVGTTASGSLSTQIRLAGAAIAGALASGDISGAAQLAGAAIGSALAAGDLSTAIRLAGAALAGAQATGDLTAPGSPASLAADAQAIAIAEGGLTTSIRLAGAAASVVQATGSLDVAVTMQASAFASAMASGVLSTQIRLDAAAVAGALASGLLTVGTAEHGARVFGWRGASRQSASRPAARQVGARPRRYG